MLKNNLLVSAIFAIRLLDKEAKIAVLNYAAQNNLTESVALSELILKGLASSQVEVKRLVVESEVFLEAACCEN